jgi:hypothetical protein
MVSLNCVHLRREARTHERRQHDEPRPHVCECLVYLRTLQHLVLRPALVVADALEHCDALLGREALGVNGGIGHPDEHSNTDKDGEPAKENINNLVGCNPGTIVERDTLYEASVQ